MGITLANNAHTTLAANISSTDTTIYVDDVDSFPALDVGDYFYCTLESTTGTIEIVKVTQINTASFDVIRGQENTIAVPFNIGARVELRLTVQNLEDQFANKVLEYISDDAYGSGWNGEAALAPSQNAVYDKFNSIDATLYGITRGATLASEGDLFTALGANFWRNGERALFGGYASQYKGTNNRTDGASFLGTTSGGFNAFWLERSAQLGSLSLRGGVGLLGGARKSDRYIYTDDVKYPVWTTATVYAAGAIVGSRGAFYQTAAGGTSGATPPSHTTGDASDGSATWTFLDYSYTAPIGVAGAVLNDIVDGSGAWAAYYEAVRTSTGGTTYGIELDVGNEGSNVTNNPYSISPAGSTIGLWLGAGRSASTPANPSTNAILIGKNNQTWNTGIAFEYQGISSGGYAIKYAAISDHAQGWFNSSGQEVFALYSTATANNERTKIVGGNSKIELYSVGGVMATISSAATAGTAADEHVNLIGYPAGTGYTSVSAHGTASNIGLRLLARGTENVYVSGVALRPITDDGTTLGTSAAKWSDLFLASGGVINFNNGNFTLTHSAGLLTASGNIVVPAEAYSASWDGSNQVPTKNDVYDKIQAIVGVTDGDKGDIVVSSSGTVWSADTTTVGMLAGTQTFSGAKTFSATPVFSNATTGLSISSTTPRILWTDTDATATQQVWDMVASNASWLFRTRSDADGAGATIMTVTRSGTTVGGITFGGPITASVGTAIPAGGTQGVGLQVSSTANFGVFFGSGAPSLSAAKGSLYLRSDGSGTNDRMYVNTNGSTTWTAVVTVA